MFGGGKSNSLSKFSRRQSLVCNITELPRVYFHVGTINLNSVSFGYLRKNIRVLKFMFKIDYRHYICFAIFSVNTRDSFNYPNFKYLLCDFNNKILP